MTGGPPDELWPCELCAAEFTPSEWRDRYGKSSIAPSRAEPGLYGRICPACTLAGRGTDWDEALRVQRAASHRITAARLPVS